MFTVKIEGADDPQKHKGPFRAMLQCDGKTILGLSPGNSVSAMGVLAGEQEQLWLSVAGGSGSSLYRFGDSFTNQICDPQMYITDILPIGTERILLAGSSSDHYRVELWPADGGLPIQVARFARPIGGGNPDTGQGAYPTFGIADVRLYVGWRLRRKGGNEDDSHALREECLVPQFRPLDDFDLTSALISAGVDVVSMLEAADESNFYRQLYV